ncbi:MAG: cadherin-like domain-containing protein [Devosia sp.]|uniref:cadherin-like domain-containing protein n=1 Tax=Devosia sp. TaxID=1871048 RepID=UPI001AC1914C|nr:cadherin-like domain-containing protein [Devosia sp.]MBN9314137.1 cadherin-like domain-containing protein [Devosia sp.]
MISIKAKRPEEPPAPDAAQLYHKLQTDALPASRWPRILALALTAVALYLKSLVPGQASTDAAPAQADAGAGESAGKPALAESGETPPTSGEEVDETGSVEAPADKAIGSGGPALGVPGLPDFLNIESRLIDYDQLPLPRYPSPIIDAGPGFSANNDNGGRDLSFSAIIGAGSASPRDGMKLVPGSAGTASEPAPEGPRSVTPPGSSSAEPAVPGPAPKPGDDDGGDGAPPSEESRNRAPRLTGHIQLADIGGCQTLLIASLALLAGATDADADPLSIAGLRVSHGQLTASEGGWVFKPPADWFGTVTLSYWVSDGDASVQQTATLRVLEFLEVTGTAGDDLLLGSDCADRIEGLGGDELIDARGGSDIVVGGAGNDHIFGGAGHDTIDAGAGDDIAFGGAGNDFIHGGAGNDSLHGGDGNDTIYGGAGRDVITGGEGDDVIDAGEGDDVIDGGSGDNVIDAGAGDDTITAGDGDNTVLAGDGCDQVILGGGDDIVKAGAGDDKVVTGDGSDRLFGEGGNDLLQGKSGKDVLDGGPGEDRVEGGPDDDVLVATSDATSDCYDGGEGQDTLDLSHTEKGVTVDLKRGTAVGIEIGSDTVIDFETILGGEGDDCLIVGEKATTLKGGGGNDRFVFAVDDEAETEELVHKILDLEAGDRIVVKQYEIGLRRDGDDDDRGDVEVDRFSKIYSDDNDDRPFRFRIEKIGEEECTYIDVYFERGEEKDFSIEVYGNQKFYCF